MSNIPTDIETPLKPIQRTCKDSMITTQKKDKDVSAEDYQTLFTKFTALKDFVEHEICLFKASLKEKSRNTDLHNNEQGIKEIVPKLLLKSYNSYEVSSWKLSKFTNNPYKKMLSKNRK